KNLRAPAGCGHYFKGASGGNERRSRDCLAVAVRRKTMSKTTTFATMLGLAEIAFLWSHAGFATAATAEEPKASLPAQGKSVDKEAWARKLAKLAEDDRRELRVDAWGIGAELAQLPADEGFTLLKQNWGRMDRVETRQQLL